MPTTLKFESEDMHGLIDLLIQAVSVTSDTSKRPTVEVNGKTYAPYELIKVAALLPYDEPLSEEHEAKVAKLFQRRQHGYGRTAYNIANLANAIAAAPAAKAAAKVINERGGPKPAPFDG